MMPYTIIVAQFFTINRNKLSIVFSYYFRIHFSLKKKTTTNNIFREINLQLNANRNKLTVYSPPAL